MYNFRKDKRKSPWILQKNSECFVNMLILEHNKVNVKFSNSQLNKLLSKNAVKNETGVTLRMSIKMIERNNLPH